MKKAIVFCLMLFFFHSVFAKRSIIFHDTIPEKTGKAMLTLMEDVYDFGKIPQGKPVNHIFEFLNDGRSALKLENVQASCGCTTPEWERNKEIEPGQKSAIKVGYNAASEGVFTKMITISYNGDQTKQISIKGEVWKTPSASAPPNKGINDLIE